MSLTNLILKLTKNAQKKTLLEVGAHDDSETIEMAKHFKKVYSYYEYLKIPNRKEKNIDIKKTPYLKVLKQLNKFDVILLENEFHHFPDIWQMWTFDKLQKNQELFLAEWDFTGNINNLYLSFQNCRPLCQLTREILDQFSKKGIIKITEIKKGKHQSQIKNRQELIDWFKFQLPDHWPFGKDEFLSKIKKINYPYLLDEGYDLFKIIKI